MRQFFTLGVAPVVETDRERLTFDGRWVLAVEVDAGQWEGPLLGVRQEVDAGELGDAADARRAYRDWTWGACPGDKVYRLVAAEPDQGEDVGPVLRVFYDGHLAGVDSRRVHDFSEPYPRLMAGPDGYQIRRGPWRGDVTALGIVG